MESKRQRISQEQRSRLTRKLILETSVKVLAADGYANYSTAKVSKAAKLSRGAQLHHFPSKRELLAATAEYAFEEGEKYFIERFMALDLPKRTLQSAVLILWEVFQGDIYKAMLELIVAAKNDKALESSIKPIFNDFVKKVDQIFSEIFPEIAAQPFSGHIVAFAFAVLQGASIFRSLSLSEHVSGIVDLLAVLADMVGSEINLSANFQKQSELVEE